MALIKCPDCGKEVSDAASACIHCGRPIAPSEKPEAKKNTNPATKELGVGGWLFIGGLVLIAVEPVRLVGILCLVFGFVLVIAKLVSKD